MTLLGASCSDNSNTIPSSSFLFPDIVDTMQTATYYYSPTLLTIPINFIKTIEKVGNKANLCARKVENDNFIDDHNLSDTTNKSVILRTGLSIFVDTTREVSMDKDEWRFPPFFFDYPPDDESNPKSKTQKLIDSLGYAIRRQAWEENKSFVRGFPVYIVNKSKHSVRVEEQDGRLMIIQEALDKSGQWKPIEFWQFSGCGNSYGGVALRPEYYIMTKVYKYKGDFETKLRLKMLNDTVVYYSQPFIGSINLTQMDTSRFEHKFRPREFFNFDK